MKLPLILLLALSAYSATRQEVPASDWAQITAEYNRHRHQITGNKASSPQQGWSTTFTPNGFTLAPQTSTNASWKWGLELKSYGLSDQLQPIAQPTHSTTYKNNLRRHHGNLEQWFLNEPSGLEQGWTILNRPTGQAQDLVLNLAITGTLTAKVESNAVRFADSHGHTIINYSGLRAWDANQKPLPTSLRTVNGQLQVSVNQHGATYPITIDPIAQQSYLKASNTGGGDRFGMSVAISGDTIVVGANLEDSNATGVNGDQTNNSAANSGAAYVFTRTGGVWSQQAYLKASNTGASDVFGFSVAISGDTIVVGAYAEASNATGVNGDQSNNSLARAGAAYVFTRSGTTWSQQAYLKASNTGFFGNFGYSVAISGDTIVVGAFGEASNATGVDGNQSDNSASSAGAAYVFTRTGTTWSQQAYLKASNTGASDQFGQSVAISGDTIVVGANGEDSNATSVDGNQSDNSASSAGAAYVFTRSGTTWSQQAYLKASNAEGADAFGSAVAISGDTIVVGAYGEDSIATGVGGNQADNTASTSGAAYVFTRSGTTWSQQAYLKASNTGTNDLFGYCVAISGDIIVVGAYLEDSNATGIDGNQSNNSSADSGAAYVFTRSGTSWSQQGYLKASNTGAADQFGWAVAISGDTAVITATLEDSNATGVGGAQNNNSVGESGAAYVFTITPNTVNVTINSSPSGLLFSSSGTGCAPGSGLATPQTLSWTPASSCLVTFPTPQSGGPTTQYAFASWEDSSTNAGRTITAPSSTATYTASFNTQYLLTVTANPANAGTVTPSAATFFNANSTQPVTATGTGCYGFSHWTGATVTGGNVTVSAPTNLVANFGPYATTVSKGPILSVRGTPNRYRQTLSAPNNTPITTSVTFVVSGLPAGFSQWIVAPTGTTSACLAPAGSAYFTVPSVAPGQPATVTLDFTSTNGTALTATAVAGPGSR